MSPLTDAEIRDAIDEMRQLVEHRLYGQALRVLESIAAANPGDPWVEGIAEEGRQLLLSAEPHVSRAEELLNEGAWEGAIGELGQAIRAYDHRPGLWWLMFEALPRWELHLRMEGRGEADIALAAVKARRREAAQRVTETEPRMQWASRLGGAYVATFGDPWPEVVRAFCDSRPAARISFERHPTEIPAPARASVEAVVADTIRTERPARETWRVRHLEPRDHHAYHFRFSALGKTVEWAREREKADVGPIQADLPAFLAEHWQ